MQAVDTFNVIIGNDYVFLDKTQTIYIDVSTFREVIRNFIVEHKDTGMTLEQFGDLLLHKLDKNTLNLHTHINTQLAMENN